MALITELDVVNRCLATMGELPINSIEGSRNPIVTNARNAFKDKTIDEQAAGWWYNIETLALDIQNPVNGVGEYRAPADTLALATDGDYNPRWLTLRGNRLYNSGKGTYHVGTQALSVRLVRLVPFDDLPYSAQRLIRDATVLKFQLDYDGDELKINEAQAQYQDAYAKCMADHTRAVRPNMLHKGGSANMIARSRLPYGATGRNR